jgi:hypothetical protein
MNESPETLTKLQEIIDRSAATAGESGDGKEGAMTTIKVTPTRIYAIRPPQGHHALRGS